MKLRLLTKLLTANPEPGSEWSAPAHPGPTIMKTRISVANC